MLMFMCVLVCVCIVSTPYLCLISSPRPHSRSSTNMRSYSTAIRVSAFAITISTRSMVPCRVKVTHGDRLCVCVCVRVCLFVCLYIKLSNCVHVLRYKIVVHMLADSKDESMAFRDVLHDKN